MLAKFRGAIAIVIAIAIIVIFNGAAHSRESFALFIRPSTLEPIFGAPLDSPLLNRYTTHGLSYRLRDEYRFVDGGQVDLSKEIDCPRTHHPRKVNPYRRGIGIDVTNARVGQWVSLASFDPNRWKFYDISFI